MVILPVLQKFLGTSWANHDSQIKKVPFSGLKIVFSQLVNASPFLGNEIIDLNGRGSENIIGADPSGTSKYNKPEPLHWMKD